MNKPTKKEKTPVKKGSYRDIRHNYNCSECDNGTLIEKQGTLLYICDSCENQESKRSINQRFS